ncbi:MAG: response regulator [bacterium]|nr:response regulator [bacterium]
MMPTENEVKKGLEGVLAGESTICYVDGTKGELYYRGYEISDLAANFTFEEVAYLLLNKSIPSASDLDEFNEKLLNYRRLHKNLMGFVKSFSKETHPMKVLQATVSALGGIWDNKDGMTADETFIAYISQLPMIIAAHWRFINGQEILQPRLDLSYAGNFLYMISGEEPTELNTSIFDRSLTLHMEHGFNASTFTARVVASSMASVSASLSAALGSLSGPLHGGANERTLEMIDAIGSVENVETFIDNHLAKKGKVSGMGHRVYRQKDPRAVITQKMLYEIETDAATDRRIKILERVESYTCELMERKGKQIYPNVDFFSGTLFTAMGINQIIFTPIFALARIVGWCAHIGEQWEDNRIYRPKCLYIGEVGKKVATPAAIERVKAAAKVSVLIVDDDVDLIEATQIPLEANDYRVASETSYMSAMDKVRDLKPDVILLDVMFPGHPTAGFDICRELKSKDDTKDIPVIIMSAINQKFDTAFSSRISREEYSSVPADHFLEKPVNPQVLLATIDKVRNA